VKSRATHEVVIGVLGYVWVLLAAGAYLMLFEDHMRAVFSTIL